MKKMILTIIFGSVAFAALPNKCMFVVNQDYNQISELIKSKPYVAKCKLLQIRLDRANNTDGIAKIVYLGYALEELKDLKKYYGINTTKSEKELKNKFLKLNKNLKAKGLISQNDNKTIFKDSKFIAFIKENRIYIKKLQQKNYQSVYKSSDFRIIKNKKECLNIKNSYKKSAKSIYKIKPYEYVKTIGQKNNYIKIEYLKGKTGWINKNCLGG
jgi:hypothetical protein